MCGDELLLIYDTIFRCRRWRNIEEYICIYITTHTNTKFVYRIHAQYIYTYNGHPVNYFRDEQPFHSNILFIFSPISTSRVVAAKCFIDTHVYRVSDPPYISIQWIMRIGLPLTRSIETFSVHDPCIHTISFADRTRLLSQVQFCRSMILRYHNNSLFQPVLPLQVLTRARMVLDFTFVFYDLWCIL